MPFIDPPTSIAWYLRPMLWLTRRITGKDPLPARLLAHVPKVAFGVGVFEVTAPGAPGDLDGRSLAIARIVASAVSGCPFCVDMNAATWSRAGLRADELPLLFSDDDTGYVTLGEREASVAHYARALSLTPIAVPSTLMNALKKHFTDRQLVVLATTIAQVNYWTRFNQGLGVPAAGFFDESVCQLPARLR